MSRARESILRLKLWNLLSESVFSKTELDLEDSIVESPEPKTIYLLHTVESNVQFFYFSLQSFEVLAAVRLETLWTNNRTSRTTRTN